jgi:hypothetical protein
MMDITQHTNNVSSELFGRIESAAFTVHTTEVPVTCLGLVFDAANAAGAGYVAHQAIK